MCDRLLCACGIIDGCSGTFTSRRIQGTSWACDIPFTPILISMETSMYLLRPLYRYWYSPTPVIRTSVIRNLDYPNAVPNVESV